MTQRPWVHALATAAVLALAACGGSDDRAATIPDQTPAVTAEPGASEEAEPAAPARLTKAQARKALLKVKDMPTGYAAQKPEPPKDNSAAVKPSKCGPLANQRLGSTLAQAEFSQGGLMGATFNQEIIAPAKGTTAVERVEQIEQLAGDCPNYTVKDASGTGTVELTALSFPDLGDYTFALRATVQTQGFTVTGDFLYIAVGPVYTRLVTTGLADTLTGEQLEKVARTAVSRIEKT